MLSLFREVLLETQWQEACSTPSRPNVPTNLSAGGAGFFAVCGCLFDLSDRSAVIILKINDLRVKVKPIPGGIIPKSAYSEK